MSIDEKLKDVRTILTKEEIYYPIGEQEMGNGKSFTLYNGYKIPTTVSWATVYKRDMELGDMIEYLKTKVEEI